MLLRIESFAFMWRMHLSNDAEDSSGLVFVSQYVPLDRTVMT